MTINPLILKFGKCLVINKSTCYLSSQCSLWSLYFTPVLIVSLMENIGTSFFHWTSTSWGVDLESSNHPDLGGTIRPLTLFCSHQSSPILRNGTLRGVSVQGSEQPPPGSIIFAKKNIDGPAHLLNPIRDLAIATIRSHWLPTCWFSYNVSRLNYLLLRGTTNPSIFITGQGGL